VSTPNLLPWVVLAVFAHGAAFAASDRPAPAVAWSGPPLEVELTPPPDPEPASPPPEPEHDEAPNPAPAPVRPMKAPAPRPAAPTVAAAAKVGALLTSGETADSADPVAFFSDPNGGAYGSGVVAHGGRAEHGTGPVATAVAPPPAPVRPSGDAVTPAADLSRVPALDEPDACRGFFPTEAAVDSAKVDLVVIVGASGRVKSVSVARESPAGEGFGAAARACLMSKQFTAALDKAGNAVTASASVRLHFTR
jgi:hypothetical protein